MNGKAAINAGLDGSRAVLEMFVADLADADLFVRPAPGANHIAWQLGHVAFGEAMMVKEFFPEAAYPSLPEGSAERYGKAGASDDGPEGFLTKDEYLRLLGETRAATKAVLDGLTDDDLDRPSVGGMAQFAPTLGHVFVLVSNHELMHVGQFSVVRRLLGKPVLF